MSIQEFRKKEDIDNEINQNWLLFYQCDTTIINNIKNTREIFRRLAVLYEKKYGFEDTPLASSCIADMMSKRLRKLGKENYIKTLYKALSGPEYSRFKFKAHQRDYSNQYKKDMDVIDEFTKMRIERANKAIELLKNETFMYMPRWFIQEKTHDILNITNKYRRISKEKKIPIMDIDGHDIQDILDIKVRGNSTIKERIKLMLPDQVSKISEERPLIAQLYLHIEIIYDLIATIKSTQLYNWSDKKEMAAAFYQWVENQRLRPYVESTWRHDLKTWAMMLKAVNNDEDKDLARIIPLLENEEFKIESMSEIDKKVMEDMAISKKQIKNKTDFLLTYFDNFHKYIKSMDYMHDFFMGNMQHIRNSQINNTRKKLIEVKNK